MNTQRWPVWAPLLGIAFVALVVLAFIVGGETPDTDDSPQKVLDFYKDNDGEQMVAAGLLGWATVLFLFFLGVLRSTLHAGEGDPPRLSAVAFAGGIVFAVGMLCFAGFTFALGEASDHLTLDAAQALHVLNTDFFFPAAAGLGTLLIATGLSSIRSRALPAWLAWSALVLGIAAITPVGWVAFLASGPWVIAASIVLWQAGARSTPAQQPLS